MAGYPAENNVLVPRQVVTHMQNIGNDWVVEFLTLKGKSQRTVMLDSYQITSVSVANNAAYDLFTGLRWEYTTKICRKLDLMWASILVPSHYFIQWNYANDI